MFTRLLVGLDESPSTDVALEQAVLLGRRFHSTITVVGGRGPADDRILLERARTRIEAAGLDAEVSSARGGFVAGLGDTAGDADAVVVGRRTDLTSLLRDTTGAVIVCGATPSPIRAIALPFDGGEPSRRALALAAQYAGVVRAIVHVIHAGDSGTGDSRAIGEAEAELSLQRADFRIDLKPVTPGQGVVEAVRRTRCDSLFAGLPRGGDVARSGLGPSLEAVLHETTVAVVIRR